MDKFQVLVIDDDADIVGWFRTVLTLMGFEVETALTARQGLAWLSANVPDLVLLDMRLGQEMGGEDILYQIRSNARFNNTRVIIITGYPNTAETVTNLADLVMVKPVELEQLKGLVGRIAYSELEPRIFPFRDPATLLYNREFFQSRLDLAFERSKRRPAFTFAVVVIQIQFTNRSDEAIQPETESMILAEIASRLKQNLRPTDTLAHLSGWKFITLNEELRSNDDVEIILERLQRELSRPYQVGAEDFKGIVTCGVSADAWRYKQSDEMIDAAKEALTKAQSLQKRF
jgi:diguanylate cyclase (GGDEF)-like protein